MIRVQHRFPLLLITLIVLLSTFQTLNFYFWHDDFTVFYDIRLNQCSFKWPYLSYCTVFMALYKVFGFVAGPYFILGVITALLCALLFYFLLLEFFPRNAALLSSLTFATFYFGAGTFLESYDSIFTFLSLSLLFIALIAIKRAKAVKDYLISLILFAGSILFFQARSSTYILPFVVLYWLSSRHTKFRKLLFSIISIAVYWMAFFVLPTGRLFFSSSNSGGILGTISVAKEAREFLLTLGSFAVPEFIKTTQYDTLRLVSVAVGTVFFLFLFFKNPKIRKPLCFGCILTASLYLPFGLRSDWDFPSTHRYIFFLVPGVMLMWTTFYKYKLWKIVTMLLIVIFLVLTNIYWAPHTYAGKNRNNFYSSLQKALPSLPDGSVLYFYAPSTKRVEFVDFMRVGGLPSEAAITTHYAKNYKDIKVIVDSQILADFLKSHTNFSENFFTFYYDGVDLIDTTEQSRLLLTSNFGSLSTQINKSLKTQLVTANGTWTGNNEALSFSFDKLNPLLPFTLSFDARAKAYSSLPVPYTQECRSCFYSSEELDRALMFLTASRKLKQQSRLQATHSGEGTKAENLNDGYPETYWVANRQEWFANVFPSLSITFSEKNSLGGIILYAGSDRWLPTKLEVKADGKIIPYQLQRPSDTTAKILFDTLPLQHLDIKILESRGGDVPVISRIEIIPKGYENIDLTVVENVRSYPAGRIRTLEDAQDLERYLSSGVPACITWQNPDGEKGKVDFLLYANGKMQNYTVPIRAIGGKTPPIFELGCLTYPIEVELKNAYISR